MVTVLVNNTVAFVVWHKDIRILLHCKVNNSQVVQDFPFKWCHVCCSLQTADGLKMK